MNHGYDDDDDDNDYQPPQQAHAGPSGILAQLMGGMGGGMGGGYGGGHNMFGGGFGMAAPPSAYDDYFKAYSAAVMTGTERAEVLYGGKIIMPPSALAKLTGLDIDGPWTFHLRNPRNPAAYNTYAGVLEFVASEGVVHLPAWMMKSLNLNEGDPIRLTGTVMPVKGKLVKVQAQSRDFEQVSDPRAVLESAFRSYSVITKGSIIEISYNSLTFEFLIVDVQPSTDANGGISVLDTDLEVDFDVPKGYVEPPRPEPKAIPTMAEKLKIDLGGTTPASAGSSRPGSSLGGEGGSLEAGGSEVFMGVGQSLSGRKVRGKGLAKKIEEVDPSSTIIRNAKPRIITPDSLSSDPNRAVPAVLSLPPGKFFFGYTYVPFDHSKAPKPKPTAEEIAAAEESKPSFGGEGVTLKGKRKAAEPASASASGSGPGTGVKEEKEEKVDPWAKFGSGSGNTLRKAAGSTAASAGAKKEEEKPKQSKPEPDDIIDATMMDDEDEEEWDENGEMESDDDEVYIEVDSD